MPKEGQLLCSHRVWQAYKKPKKPKKEKIEDYAVCPGDPDALASDAISTTHLAGVFTAELEEAQCDPHAELDPALLAEQILYGMTNLTAEEFEAYKDAKRAEEKRKKRKPVKPKADPKVLIHQAVEANVPIGLGIGSGVLVKR